MDVSALGHRVSDRMAPWRPVLWTLLTVASLVPFGPHLALAGLLALGGAAMVLADRLPEADRVWWRLGLLCVTAAAGLVTTLVEPRALGPVPVLVVASVAPRYLPRRVAWTLSWVLGIAFAVTVAVASGTLYGALAGAAAPLLTARSSDRVALRIERDRATALLAELRERRAADLHAAAAEERARIARDLHDVLAHTLSGLSLHLQAARALAARRPDADPTLDTLPALIDRAADLARTGLDEAREAVAALREDVPREADLLDLVAGHEGVRLDVEGAFDGLHPPVREAAFATVREALTNAGRHAPGAGVTVRVVVGAQGAVAVDVRDDGSAATPLPHDVGSGRGLQGLAERARRVGGTLEAGPDAPGWRVTLRVPQERP